MNAWRKTNRQRKACLAGIGWLLWVLASCTNQDRDRLQGYVEGEFVYIAAPFAGALESLQVQRGAQVKSGDPLFWLDSTSEKSVRDEAERKLAQARATWEDVKKGKRPSEIEALQAQLKQVRAAYALSEREFKRQQGLMGVPGATVELDVDRARSTRDQTRQRVAELEAELRTAQLGSRSDQVIAAGAEVRAREAALAKADWELSQKRQKAPKAGLVFDTLYREGEWVAAGRPVVVLLPPLNIKVRTFVPETLVGTIQPGRSVSIWVDGISEPLSGAVSYISQKAEYTPPVIYSQASRHKLVFMVEAVFPPDIAAGLHPGQPVDVAFGSAR
ncbi:MAG: HlyD family secretion protein [Nitrospira sp.]